MNDTNRRYHDSHAPHPPAFLSRSEQRRLDLQPGAIETVDAIKRERDALRAENARLREALTALETYWRLPGVRTLMQSKLATLAGLIDAAVLALSTTDPQADHRRPSPSGATAGAGGVTANMVEAAYEILNDGQDDYPTRDAIREAIIAALRAAGEKT
jgi:hypothetical protein